MTEKPYRPGSAATADRIVSLEYVDWLRRIGASDDLVRFTDHHAARFSEHDMDHKALRWFLIGAVFAAGVIAVVLRVLA